VKAKKQLYITSRKEWRSWLRNHHQNFSEVWLIFYKKHTSKPTLDYESSVEQALCFGWIDSIIKNLDEEKYVRKFTPRNPHSNWSEINKKRANKMIRENQMTKFGMEKILSAKESETWNMSSRQDVSLVLPEKFKETLSNNLKAKDFFEQLAPSYKKQYIGWISAAKQQKTRNKRIKKAIDLLNKKEKLGLK